MTDDDLDRELQAHLECEADEQRERGLSGEEAAFAARRALGNIAHIKEDVRAVSPWSAVDDFAQDLRYGLRMLRKHPAFAIVAAVTLALGVGATTAIFSIVDAVLLRPLPYADVDRLAMVWENVNLPAYTNAQNTPSPGNFRDWRDRNSTFVDLAAIRAGNWNLTDGGDPIRVEGENVSASLFRLLQIEPLVGRLFTPDEDAAGAGHVALLGHALWTDRFASNPNIVGQTIHLNDVPYTVVGVLPRGFHFPDPTDQLYVPLGLTPQQLANHGSHFLRVVGRLKPGVTLPQAQADLDAVARRLTAEFPQSNTGVGVTVVALPEQIVGDVRAPLLIMLGVVAFVLLMVCANIGNLLLARASAREREFAVRAALGATRVRLLRQMLAESVLLSAIGGVAGLALAYFGVEALRALAPSTLPRIDDIKVNGAVAAFDVAVALAAGILCGLVPALQVRRADVADALKDEARGSTARGHVRARNLLIVAETALGVVVLVGAGLLLRTFVHLTRLPVGFDSERVLTFSVALPPGRYATEPQRTAFYARLSERLQATAGVASASAISFLPLSMQGRTTAVSAEGDVPAELPSQARFVDFRSVAPGYFRTMSIPIRAGRDVAWSDTPAARPAVVVSETLARTFWPNQDPLGKWIKRGRPQDDVPKLIVVGVVGDVRQLDLIRMPRPAVYFPAAQDQGTGDTLRDWVVRTSDDPMSIAAQVRAAVWALDPALPVTRIQPMERVRSAVTATQQFNLLLVGLFAILALVLAAIGLYGVTSYSVEQRTRELGIRVALGARRAELLRLVLAQGTRLAVIGLVAGTIAALALTRFMTALLFGVGARDPLTFAGVALLLLAVSLVASFIPAHRATRVDPVIALRT